MNKVLLTFILCVVLKTAHSIKCYVCNATDSTHPFQCGEWFQRFDQPDIEPQDCSSVHDAKYCIKHVGRFEVSCIKCYQCSAANTMSCSDLVINMHDSPIQPESCDHVIDAKYCIKSTALNGGIGAKRYCSSKDLGNYCDYVKQRGDIMEYHSCIFTCSTDGCNNTSNIMNDKFIFCLIISLFFLLQNSILQR